MAHNVQVNFQPKQYTYGTFSCLSDVPVCLEILCCGICCIPTIAAKIGAEDTHDCSNTCKCILASYFTPCALCCCFDHISPCYLSRLLDRSMAFHKISQHPAPCGQTKCGCCYVQMCLGCFMPCTLCLIFREANNAEANGFNKLNPPV